MAEFKLKAILRAFHEANVDFLVVGGLAAVLNGASVSTFDVDIVHSRTPENIERMLPVLDSLDAIYRMQPARRLKPNTSHLSASGHNNLITRYGPLDVLGTIGKNLGYEDLLPHSTEMQIDEGLTVRVLDLGMLITLKEELSGEKDRAMLPLLRQTLKERQRS